MTDVTESQKISNFIFIYFFILTLFLFIYLSFVAYNYSNTEIKSNGILSFLSFLGLLSTGIYFSSTFSFSEKLGATFFSIQGLYTLAFYFDMFIYLAIIYYIANSYSRENYQIETVIKQFFESEYLNPSGKASFLKIILFIFVYTCSLGFLGSLIYSTYYFILNSNENLLVAIFLGTIFLLSLGYFIKSLSAVPNLFTFLNYSKLLFIILYIIFLNFLFTYSGDIFSKYFYAFAIIYSIITGLLFYRSYAQPINPYFERPQKISLLICLLFLLLQLYIYNPGNFLTSYGQQFILLCFLFGLFIIPYILVYFFVSKENFNTYINSINYLFVLAAFIIFIIWLVTIFTNNPGTSFKNWISVFFTIFIFFLVAYIIYKTYKAQFIYGNKQKNALFDIIIDSIFFIPCLISDTATSILSWFNGQSAANTYIGKAFNASKRGSIYAAGNVKNTPIKMWVALIVSIFVLVIYSFFPTINKYLYSSAFWNTIQLINEPKPLNQVLNAGTFQDLELLTNNADNTTTTAIEPNYNYNYGISLWIYIDALPPTTNSSYSTYSQIFSYGNKPLIEYNAIKNSLRIKMGDDKSEGSRIVYEGDNIKLQKWTNLIINYDGGIVDVFMDGKLLKSTENVVPYMNMDAIVIGADNGIYGEVKNVLYSSKPFTLSNIYYMPKFNTISLIFALCFIFLVISLFLFSSSFIVSVFIVFIFLLSIFFLFSYNS